MEWSLEAGPALPPYTLAASRSVAHHCARAHTHKAGKGQKAEGTSGPVYVSIATIPRFCAALRHASAVFLSNRTKVTACTIGRTKELSALITAGVAGLKFGAVTREDDDEGDDDDDDDEEEEEEARSGVASWRHDWFGKRGA